MKNLPHPAVILDDCPQLLSVIKEMEAGTYPLPADAIWRGDLPDALAVRLALATGATGEQLKRTFTKARREQGFQSQEHLDAFYAYLDHQQECTAAGGGCGPGPDAWMESDASWQPTLAECPQAKALYQAEMAFSPYTPNEG